MGSQGLLCRGKKQASLSRGRPVRQVCRVPHPPSSTPGEAPRSQLQPLALQTKPEVRAWPPSLSDPQTGLESQFLRLLYQVPEKERWKKHAVKEKKPRTSVPAWSPRLPRCPAPSKPASQSGDGRVRLTAFPRAGMKFAALDLFACLLIVY